MPTSRAPYTPAEPRERPLVPPLRRTAAMLLGVAVSIGVCAAPAHAHPLGNYTVNHFHGLRVYPDRVEDTAVIDDAEIPTRNDLPLLDTDGNGTAGDQERTAYAGPACQTLAGAVALEVDGHRLAWQVTTASYAYRPGTAGQPTSRISCALVARTDLRRGGHVSITDTYRRQWLGWYEITAVAHGVHLAHPPVPATSVSHELRAYPRGRVGEPLHQRSVHLDVRPGPARLPVSVAALAGATDVTGRAAARGSRAVVAGAAAVAGTVAAVAGLALQNAGSAVAVTCVLVAVLAAGLLVRQRRRRRRAWRRALARAELRTAVRTRRRVAPAPPADLPPVPESAPATTPAPPVHRPGRPTTSRARQRTRRRTRGRRPVAARTRRSRT